MRLLTKSSLFMNFWDFGELVEDLSVIDRSTETLFLSPKTKDFSLLLEFKKLKKLNIPEQIREDKFDVVSKIKSLQSLRIKWLQVKDLSLIKNLKNLEYLMINNNSKAEDISAFGNLINLKGLTLVDFQKVKDISPLSKLTYLEELAIEGGMWKAMKINSVKPLQNLTNLRILSMTNLYINDNSLRTIGKLTNLKQLSFGNFFSVKEIVYLKNKLPKTDCVWFKPIHELKNVHCKKCVKDTVQLTGQGSRKFCLTCDSEKVAKLIKDFR